MPSPGSPALRALRRLVASDPETPLRVDRRGVLVSLRAALAWAVRPVIRPMDELLGESGAGVEAASPEAGPEAEDGAPEWWRPGPGRKSTDKAPRKRRGSVSDRAGDALVGLDRHRRAMGVAACLLIVSAAGISVLPPIEAAAPPDIYVLVTPGAEPLSNESAVDQSGAGAEADFDGSIYNVMQAVDAPVGATGFQVYVVRSGDNLAKIGSKFGLNRLSIYWANASRLPDPSKLRVGQKLTIPPADGVTVTVKANDTLSGIASRYKSSVKSIQTANRLTTNTVTVGQVLLVPVTPPAMPPAKVVCGAGCTYVGQKLKWPVPSSHTITQYYSSAHWGLDIGAHYGAPVIAAVGGTVLWSGWKTGAGSGGGVVVWINSGGKIYTTYNHLSRVYVKKGQAVKAGQRIANVGSTGLSTGPHLHFEVWSCYPWSDGTSCARNPLRYM